MYFKNQKKKIKLKNDIIIVGDIGCRWYNLMVKIIQRKLKDKHIIILGNFGIGNIDKILEKENLFTFNQKLLENNNHLYLIRGNLDNKFLFTKYKELYSNIYFANDNANIKNISGIDFLFIGGSINLDRIHHIESKKNERIKNKTIITHHQEIDVIVSHESPDFVYPYNLSYLKLFAKVDKWLYNDVIKNRKALSEVFETVTKTKFESIYSWYCGKYDKNITEIKKNVKFIYLSRMNMVNLII